MAKHRDSKTNIEPTSLWKKILVKGHTALIRYTPRTWISDKCHKSCIYNNNNNDDNDNHKADNHNDDEKVINSNNNNKYNTVSIITTMIMIKVIELLIKQYE